MNLAVISDLHVGLAARSKDLCPEPPTTSRNHRAKYDSKTDNSYRQKFVEFVKREVITADYLVLPGDITDKADPREVRIASEFVLQASDALGVPHDKIIFVPGNHDVDWSVFDPNDDTGVRWGQRYDPIGHCNFHFRQRIGQGDGDILSPPHFIAWAFDNLLAVCYNSASHDSPVSEDVAHHGLADPTHLDAICEYIKHIGHSDDQVRLFLVHHHPLDFATPIPRTPDFSLMTNAESLLTLLHEYGFDLLIHGHRHHPRFETHNTQTYPHLPILCSGSFSVEIDTQWAGTIDNQFHLVTVSGRGGIENRINGKITSWTNNHCRGWIPSEESTSGIHHVIPFGSYVMPRELDARLEPFIRQWLKTHDHILWKQIVEEFPDLEHLPLNSALEAFKRMAQRFGRKTMYEILKDLILY
ncbi:MAG: metallophosphoesterase [Candidatus Latescibacterota bacterium]